MLDSCLSTAITFVVSLTTFVVSPTTFVVSPTTFVVSPPSSSSAQHGGGIIHISFLLKAAVAFSPIIKLMSLFMDSGQETLLREEQSRYNGSPVI